MRADLVGRGFHGSGLEAELRKWEARQQQRPGSYLASINSVRGSR
jgi:hypothetical protein